MALTGLAIAAGLALAKHEMIDKPQAARQRKLAAETQRYSPWTGLHADPVQDPNAIGSMMGAGATGAMIGSGLEKDSADVALKKAQAESLKKAAPAAMGEGAYAMPSWKSPWSSVTQENDPNKYDMLSRTS